MAEALEVPGESRGADWKIHQLTEPGPALDAVYRELLLPSFSLDELSTLEELSQVVAAGQTLVWVTTDADGRLLGTAIGEWEPGPRVVLLAWLAVRPGLRGGGIGGPLLRAALDAWQAAYDPCLILTEIADPAHPHGGDEAHGDPAARLRFYRRLGARALDLPYFQAALGGDRARVDDMLLLVLRSHP
ncbi:GNAT family N-acetyltransferase, partial [Streptomyces tateyamensis]|uniref:GNAT family N-acetyltransferase n=1 Tax=Streptomyces tateyamensis TaxID=565073 RepID=UPI000DA2240E